MNIKEEFILDNIRKTKEEVKKIALVGIVDSTCPPKLTKECKKISLEDCLDCWFNFIRNEIKK